MIKTFLKFVCLSVATWSAVQAEAVEYYGLDMDFAWTNAPTSSRIFPVSAGIYKMIQPDGTVRMFQEDETRPGVIIGKMPWVGVISGNSISVCADPDFTEGRKRTAFNFIGGKLKSIYLDGETVTFSGFKPQEDNPEQLWPEQKKWKLGKNQDGDIWKDDTSRLRLWFTNPNVAGMLFAQLALLGLACAASLKRKFRLIAGLPFVGLMLAGLFMTGSRSAFIAFVIGFISYSFLKNGFLRGNITPRMLIVSSAVIVCLAVILLLTGQVARFTGNLFAIDASNSMRIDIAKAAMMSIADAPCGWHGGFLPAHTAWLNWYEPSLKRTVWTHFTFMAEIGWVGTIIYLSLCAFLLIFSFRLAKKGTTPLAFSILAAYFIAGWLNPVYGYKSLFVIPILSFIWACLANPRPTRREFTVMCILSGVIAICLMGGMIVFGKAIRPSWLPPITVRGKRVEINGCDAKVWVVEDRYVLGGRAYPGREIILHYLRNPNSSPMGYVHAVRDLPEATEVLVLPGKTGRDYIKRFNSGTACKAKKILFLSPAFDPCEIPSKLNETSEVLVVCGDLAVNAKPEWENLKTTVQILEGIEQYIPDWPKIILPKTNARKQKNE